MSPEEAKKREEMERDWRYAAFDLQNAQWTYRQSDDGSWVPTPRIQWGQIDES